MDQWNIVMIKILYGNDNLMLILIYLPFFLYELLQKQKYLLEQFYV